MTFTLLLTLSIIIPYCLAESWTISVFTGKKRFAGTDSNVYIRLYNSEGVSTLEYQLTHHNWIPEKNGFPLRNLFEVGAKDRFHISTTNIQTISKILIRHDNYPIFQADWLLDQIIIERDSDGTKYIFQCNCWLRKDRPYTTLSSISNQNSTDKNKINSSFGHYKRTFVIILLLLISISIGMLCFYNEYRRRQRNSSLSFTDTMEPMQQETNFLDSHHPEISQSELPLSRTQYWINTIRHWKTLPPRFSSERRERAAQTTSLATPADEPPSYEDLYPNRTVPMTNASNST